MKIVILGHTGFLGGALFKHFKKAGKYPVNGYNSTSLDLTTPESVTQLREILDENTVLIVATFIGEKKHTVDGLSSNVIVDQNIARALEQKPVKKCLYISSNSVYGEEKTNLNLTEETQIGPTSLYGVSSYIGEQTLRIVAANTGFPILVLRCCKVYGPGDHDTTSYSPGKLINNMLQENKIFLFGEGEDKRDFLFVDDFLKITERLLFKDLAGTFNLATGESHSFQEMANTLCSITSRRSEIIFLPRKLKQANLGFNIKKLLAELPNFSFTSLEQGLLEVLDSMAKK